MESRPYPQLQQTEVGQGVGEVMEKDGAYGVPGQEIPLDIRIARQGIGKIAVAGHIGERFKAGVNVEFR